MMPDDLRNMCLANRARYTPIPRLRSKVLDGSCRAVAGFRIGTPRRTLPRPGRAESSCLVTPRRSVQS